MSVFRLMGLCSIAILFFVGCAGHSSSTVTPDETLVAKRLSHEDLRYFEESLYDGHTKYVYRIYSRQESEGKYSVIRAGVLDGALVMGHPSSRIPLFDGTTTDNRFNRIAARQLMVNDRSAGWIQQSSMPDGSTMSAFSGDDANGRVSFAVILTAEEQIILMLAEELMNALPCIHERAMAGSINGMGDCTGEGSGGGGSGAGMFGGFVDLLGEPDCGDGMLGRVSIQTGRRYAPRNGQRRVSEIEEQMEQIRDYRNGELSDNQEGRDIYGQLSNSLAIERRANQRLAEAEANLQDAYDAADAIPGERRSPEAERRVRRAQAEVRARESAVQTAEELRRERQKDAEIFERNRRRSGSGNSGGGEYPVFGEEPEREDPRCAGRRVDGERGTLFTNEDFCRGDDPLTCLRRQQDSIYSLTEGQCWTETGPDDNQRFVCGETVRPGRGETLPSQPPPQDGSCPDDDFGCWTDPVAPRGPGGHIHLRYIDVTPLGGVLFGLCAAGGCPQT